MPFAVTDDDQGGEAEATTTLDDLGDAVDGDDALDVGALLGLSAATVVAAAAVALAIATRALSALGSAHETFLFSLRIAT